jgi:hypothetical protein
LIQACRNLLGGLRRKAGLLLEPIENHLRASELLDPAGQVVIRGWPLTVAGLCANAEATSSRYSYRGSPLVAASSELTMVGWDPRRILSSRRLRTRRSYASAPAARILEAGFGLLPTFDAPHHSIVWPSYNETEAERLLEALGEVLDNPYYVRTLR